jgi:peptidoglycan/xylan/chitin deacetylase (PgdA/CDA1 family)
MLIIKKILATVFYWLGISWISFLISRFFFGSHIRVVNYHGTPESEAGNFEQHLKWYKKWYDDVSFDDLNQFLETGKWLKSKPGIILSFDDGKRNNYDIGRPLLEKYGLTGWFFIPTDWVNASVTDQRIEHAIDLKLLAEYPSDRIIVNEPELISLQKKHVIGCHTKSHHRMKEDDNFETLTEEIQLSKSILEKYTGKEIKIFCWVGGEEINYTNNAARLIEKSGYDVSFTTNTFPILKKANKFNLHRTNIETNFSMPLLLFQLSGLMDLLYFPKRKRLKKVFSPVNS